MKDRTFTLTHCSDSPRGLCSHLGKMSSGAGVRCDSLFSVYLLTLSPARARIPYKAIIRPDEKQAEGGSNGSQSTEEKERGFD